jgi:hypothetical protein
VPKRTALACPPPPRRLKAVRTWTEEDVEAEVLRRLDGCYGAIQSAILATIAENWGIDPEAGPAPVFPLRRAK